MISHIFLILLLIGTLWCIINISISDLRRRIIPDVFLFPLMLIGFLLITFFPYPIGPETAVIGACFGYAMAAIIGFTFDYFLRRQNPDAATPIGMGDIKLIGVGGLWLGTSGLAIALIISRITGGIWARIKHQKYIPFAPFFLFGGILAFIAITFLI
jgi:prepilin signal peptidase PulO-like enzyme (type II secretory pathway)